MLAALVLAVLPGMPARAQGVGQAHGTVFNKDRRGVPGLTVAIMQEAGSVIHGTSTDERGQYSFKGLEGGIYSVIVQYHGAGIARKDGIRVRALFRSIVDFNLPGDFQAAAIPAVAPSSNPTSGAEGLTVSWSLVGPERKPTPDASVTLTPSGGGGRLQHDRTDEEGLSMMTGVQPGSYRIAAKAPGFMTWVLEPVPLTGQGELDLTLEVIPFPMGFEGILEDLLIPAEPIPPEDANGTPETP